MWIKKLGITSGITYTLFALTGAKHAHAKRAREREGVIPRKRPRVSGARKRLLRTRAKRESVASYSKARGLPRAILTFNMVGRFEFSSP